MPNEIRPYDEATDGTWPTESPVENWRGAERVILTNDEGTFKAYRVGDACRVVGQPVGDE